MATFNTSTHAAGVLNSSITAAPLHLDAFVPSAVPSHFISSTPTAGPTHGNPHHHQQQQQQQQQTNTTSSYTFVQIKREPCQVSEVTTSNNCNQSATTTTTHHHQQHHGIMSASNSISASKTMSSSSTLTTLVKIEASSPKVHEMDKTPTLTAASSVANTNNSVPIGIAVARKRPQESSVPLSSSIPMQQNLNKDMTCFGIRMGSVGGSCSNIYFTGNGDLMTGATTAATAEELALSAAGVQSVNRAPSTFWQYPSNALPIESVISMSPATVGLQYSREASRGQVVLLPATTALDPFQQAAAAFVWPATAYIPQASAAAPAAATALQPPPNFIFPSMSPHSTLQPQSYATSLQLFGSNYLSAAAAAAAAAASNTLCQHNQQTASQTTSSINLSLAGTGGSTTSSSCSTSSRFLSMAAAELQKQSKHQLPNAAAPISNASSAASVPPLLMPPATLKIEDWNAAEYITAAAKTATTSLSQQNQLAPPLITSAPPLNFEARDKTTTTTTTTMTTNLLELQGSAAQALNLMRLPTPPTSATMASAQHLLFQTTSSPSPALLNLSATAVPRTSVVSSASAAVPISTTATTGGFLNGTNVAHFSTSNIGAAGGPLTPLGDDATAVNYKITSPTGTHLQIVVPVSRTVTNYQSQSVAAAPPQMQDVNIQTDTPVCSEDESSSCPLAIQQQLSTTLSASAALTNATTHGNIELYAAHDNDAQQPLELTRAIVGKSAFSAGEAELVAESNAECHNNAQREDVEQRFAASPELRLSISGPVTNPSVSASPAAVHETVPPVNSHVPEQVAPEDLTGLELLSNISTSTLAKSVSMRVKQEPLEQMDAASSAGEVLPQVATEPCDTHVRSEIGIDGCCSANSVRPFLVPPVAAVEPLGGLSLLCALAEQRIQEEVQSSGGSLFTAVPPAVANNENVPSVTPTATSAVASTPFHFQRQSPFGVDAAFPSMEGIELPSTSCVANGVTGETVKRKKHKHSKSSKSSSSSTSASGKKAQRCNKKNKKNKYSKEMRKQHKLLAQVEPDWEDEQLQEELNSAFGCVDATSYTPFGKWHNPQEIFSMMETNMRMRLADISRQYRRKKRKLDEISHKNKKKKKCSKLAAVSGQQLVLGGSSALSLGGVSSCSTPTATLGEYKFSNFACAKSSSAHAAHLHASSFLRFGEKTQHLAQFPPPDMGTFDGSAEQQQLDVRNGSASTSAAATVYKPVRLEPSALSAADSRGLALRVGHKHASSEQSAQMIVCKERKLMTTPPTSIESNTYKHTSEGRGKCSGSDLPALQIQQSQQPAHRNSNDDGSLMLTDEHLYSKETRVLTDMGGLFYAGVMKPLQPPDVYAITLDGERGNKPHIMSREEILKDTILELAPKSVESVPVGTRLCAYWSQQYRCLYPGRAIESESSDDGCATPDFVSVEFDDGDSGRIRLQNIRLLLSDYPIVEYNDNPLYSIGKHKKSSASACADKSGVDDGYSPVSQQQYSCSLLEEPVNGVVERLCAPSAASEVHQQTALKLYSQRSEKKRIKSLKKKAQAMVNGGAGVAGDSTAVGVGEASSNDCSRKHHKHKKRKKHKKHHHRKMALNGNSNSVVATAEGNAFMLTSCSNNSTPAAAATASGFISKREFEHLSHVTQVTEEQQGDHHADVDESEAEQQLNDAVIKTEGPSAVSAIKIKAEHLDLEEETTSNLMSEVSDENKGEDEVEHNNSKGSKIAAFLPERQLWGWLGTAYRKAGVKGRARKQFYKTIKRGKETITVGDCAVFLSTGRPDRPYIGRIESMWETTSSNKVVRVRWFYHPEETTGCSNLQFPGALFESPHEDENDVQTISHRCEVLPFARYFSKFGADSKQYQSIYDNNDTYYLAGYYNPRSQVLNIQDDIPTLEEERNISEV